MTSKDFAKRGYSVFARDEISLIPDKNFKGCVINLDVSTGTGTHWVCCWQNPTTSDIHYYDPLGCAKPPKELYRRYRSQNIYYNYERDQSPLEKKPLCGYLVLEQLNRWFETVQGFPQGPFIHIPISNFAEPEYKNPNSDLPFPLRLLVVGPSNCGKTNFVMNIIYKQLIPFLKVVICSKTLDQPFYRKLIQEVQESESELDISVFTFVEDIDQTPKLCECSKYTLFIFDDCMLESQNKTIKEYFTQGRHKFCSVVYISQCFTLVDKKAIRNNINCLVAFKQNSSYIKKIWETNNCGMELKHFEQTCNTFWKNNNGFVCFKI